ncbi:MAG: glycosyltransferase family 2 protein [Acidobacteriaceae bacterium]|nr:glycosyltransferase family 2 protein [Acidobacteriaceae bacterium]
MSTFDVIIPFYNTNIEYTRAALQSVVAQTYAHWKAYVINDGSTDSSTRALESLLTELNDARIVYLRQNNAGVAAARNNGILASSSPYVALLDSDDVWHSHKLETQVAIFEKHPDVGAVYAPTDRLRDGKLIPYRPGTLRSLVGLDPHALFVRMLKNNVVPNITTAVRRVYLDRAGLYDGQFNGTEDKELCLRLLLHGCRFHYVDEALAIYRVHAASISRNGERMWQDRLRIVKKLDDMIRFAPREWPPINWPRYRTKMIRHAYIEAGEEALDQGNYSKAIAYSLPHTGGVSSKTGLLIIRSLYRIGRSAVGAER